MLFWLYIIVLIILLSFVYASLRAAPWVPMRSNDVKRAIDLAEIKEGEVFYDLGSGDGRMIFAAARVGARAIGFEISLLPYLIARSKEFFVKAKIKPQTKLRDFWSIDLSAADIVYIFLMPKIREKMKEKMGKELRPGTKIICYVWPIPGWQPDKIDDVPGRPKLYLYTKGS
jgi:SAM-dependent methyltransferase